MRSLLCPRLSPTTCVFKDILEIFGEPGSVAAYFDSLSGYENMLASARNMQRWSHGWCLTHNTWCPFRQSRLRVQGPPCVDWSAAGLRGGVEGPFFKTLLAAGAKTDLTAPCLSLLENVPGLPMSVVQDCYGPSFAWQSLVLSPADVGFGGVARTRAELMFCSRAA